MMTLNGIFLIQSLEKQISCNITQLFDISCLKQNINKNVNKPQNKSDDFRQDFLQQILFSQIMLAACQVGLGIAGIYYSARSIQLDIRINRIWKKYSEEISSISELNQYISKLSFSQALLSQLQTTRLFAYQNWKSVGNHLKQNSQSILNFWKLLQKQQPQEPTVWDYSKKIGQLMAFATFTGVSVFRLIQPSKFEQCALRINETMNQAYQQAYQTAQKKLEIFNEYLQNPCKAGWQKCKEMGAKFKNKISEYTLHKEEKSILKMEDIQKRSINIDSQQQGSQKQSIYTDQATSLNEPTANNCKKQGILTVGNFVRAASICYGIYCVFKGLNNVQKLAKQLNASQQYFSENGQFEQEIDCSIKRLKALSRQMLFFAQTSRSLVDDLSQLYLVKSLMDQGSRIHYHKCAMQLKQKEYRMTDKFIIALQQFCKKIEKADLDNKLLKDKLKKIKQEYKIMFENYQPHEVFLNFFEKISTFIARESGISTQLREKQQKFRQLGSQYHIYMLKGRKNKLIFNKKTEMQKQEIDKRILRQAEELYKAIIFEDQGAVLTKRHEKQMASILAIYCDNFYATDVQGKTICGHPISDLKINELSTKIGKNNPNGIQYVSLNFQSDQLEQEERKKMLKLVEKQAKKDQEKYEDILKVSESNPQQVKRYLKLKVQEMGQNTNTPSSLPKNGNPAAILVGTNGIKFKVKGVYYTFEQQMASELEGQLTKLEDN